MANFAFEDVVIENCSFTNNALYAVYFHGTSVAYDVRRLRFVRNSIDQPFGRGFIAVGSAVSIQGMVLEDNTIEVDPSRSWATPQGCLARSVGNTWIGDYPALPAEVWGVQHSTEVATKLGLGPGALIGVSSNTRLLRVAGSTAVTATLAPGAYDSQVVHVVGWDELGPVTLLDGPQHALGADRTLGAGDTLVVVWDARSNQWCELSYSDN